MDFSNVQYNTTENILDFDNHFQEERSAYRELFANDSQGNESFVADSFTTNNESFATTVGFEEATGEEFESSSGEYRESRVILMDGSDHFGVSIAKFDSKEELIWAGNQGGHVTSYLSADLMKYTSFQVNATEEVRDLSTIDAGVLALTPTTIHMRTRQGIPLFTHRCEEFENLQCMLPMRNGPSAGGRILFGGHQSSILDFDLNKREIITKLDIKDKGCVILREHPRFVCHGDMSGTIFLHDPRTLRQEHSFQAHSGSLSDFDAEGNHIITCGFSNRMGQIMSDQFVMVFDMRMMKMSLPLRALVPPYFLRIMPGLSPCLAAVSSMGQWVVMDASQPESSLVSMNYQVSNSPESLITTFDISSSSQGLIFGDSHGSLQLFTSGNKPVFNNFSQETELPIVDEAPSHIPITDVNTSLSTIPVYYPHEPALSDWPVALMKNSYWRTPTVDPQILQAMKYVSNAGYAPNILNKKRNQVPYNIRSSQFGYKKSQLVDQQSNKNDEGYNVHVPRRYRRIEIKYNKMGQDEFDFDSYNRTSFSGLDMSLPNSYCNAMIQMFYYIAPLRASMLSHLCEKEFCLACELGFLFHMLDTNIGQGAPCHASNFLRAFRTIPEASAMSLTISDQDNRARINFASKIQSWNCFVLQQIHSETFVAREINHLKERERISFGAFDHFPQLDSNFASQTEMLDKQEVSPVSDTFGAQIMSVNKCTRCGHTIEKEVTSLTFNLSFHESATELSQGSIQFSTVLQNSICNSQVTQAWCDSCSKYQPVEQLKKFKSLPSVLAINCGLDSSQDIKFWQSQHEHLIAAAQEKAKESETGTDGTASPSVPKKKPEPVLKPTSSPMRNTPGKARPCRYGTSCVRNGCRFWHPFKGKDDNCVDSNLFSIMDQSMEFAWVPQGLRAKLSPEGSVTMTDISKALLLEATDNEDGLIYDLVGVVSHVSDPRFPDKNNLVCCIKVGPTYHQRAKVSPVAHWYLFNDVSILPISADEATWFCGWKTPCVLYWQKRTVGAQLQNLREKNPISTDVFGEDKSLAQRGKKRITFTPLTTDEMPKEGEMLAMDAEFVNLHQEEAEIRSDGTKTTIKPSQKSVARITCIRGQGPLAGTPFLDDYISTQEQVVDYLTQFSGIKPGDLDANYSQKHLTTLKSTYVKIRYLVDTGVKIVGHGLKNDLRVINMVVPQNQLIDTVHLFHLPHNRMVSLKFLAWHFLGVKIQSVTHDSIEDAKTALLLYKEYLKLSVDKASFMDELQKLYEAGKKHQWKVPGEEDDE